jgi:hypothetical protein
MVGNHAAYSVHSARIRANAHAANTGGMHNTQHCVIEFGSP